MAKLLGTHDPQKRTCVYIHGNRQTTNDACGQGLVMHEKLVAPNHDCRFIVWSWPSEAIVGRPVTDARRKATRADGEAFFVASFLSRLPGQSKVALIGYSYGARTVSGCLQLLAGGIVGRNRLPEAVEDRVRPNVAFLAAAFPRHWLIPNHAHGRVVSYSKSVVSFHNRKDPLLRRYDTVFHNEGSPRPLGYQGIARHLIHGEPSRFIQVDATAIAGNSHSLYRMTDSKRIIEFIRETTLN